MIRNTHQSLARTQPFATFETSTNIEELRHLLGTEMDIATRRLEAGDHVGHACPRFDVHAAVDDGTEAHRLVRGVLCTLLDAADRGLVDHFRIICGVDLLRHLSTGPGRRSGSWGGGR